MSYYDFRDLPKVVQKRILNDFKSIAQKDGNNLMISKAELQEYLSSALNGQSKKGYFPPRHADAMMDMYSNMYEDIDTNDNGLDIEEFTAMFGDRYMAEYSKAPLSSTIFGLDPKTLDNSLGMSYGYYGGEVYTEPTPVEMPTTQPEPVDADTDVQQPVEQEKLPPPLPQRQQLKAPEGEDSTQEKVPDNPFKY